MIKCDDILKYIDQYWSMDDNNITKIEIEAHLCDCEHCAGLFDIGLLSSHQHSTWDEPAMTADGVRISDNVMNRIYQEQDWAMPIHKKKYQFTKQFKRNIALVVASSLTLLFVAIFSILSDDGQASSHKVEANQSGVIDVVVARGSAHTTDVFAEHVAVASLSDPVIMKAVPSYSQYYVALAIIAIIGTLLVLNWFSRTKQ